MQRPFSIAGVLGMAFLSAGLLAAAARADEPQETGAAQAKQDAAPAAASQPPQTLGILLYEGFEPLDVYGPVEIFGNVPKLKLVMVAEKAGPVKSVMGHASVADFGFDDCPELDLLLVPGGIGTLKQMRNETLHTWLRDRAERAQAVMSVCSGSAILAKAGLLDGKKATTNKQSFKLLTAGPSEVEWVKEARWVDEGDRITSSGVSAGIDMSLHVVAKIWGMETAEAIADGTEYIWNRDAENDPFARFAK